MLYILKTELMSLLHCLRDLIVWLIPEDWFVNQFIRPLFLRLLGMKIGTGCTITRANYCGSLGNISIGDNTFINQKGFFHAGGKINIGQQVTIGFQVLMITSFHEIGPPKNRCGALIRKGITIEDGVWIASGVLIGPDVTIGSGSIVASGAVVMKSMPKNCLIGGVPAKVIKEL